MKTVFFGWLLLLFSFPLSASEEKNRTISVLAHGELYQLAQSPTIISAVSAQNARKFTLEQIIRADREWRNSSSTIPLMKEVMENDCANFLRTLQKRNPYLAEIIVTDNLGANVAITARTSDYWQGDEKKFQNAMNRGKGAVFIGELEFDDSAQVKMIQVTIPVMKESEAIGTVIFGINPLLLGK